MTSDDLDISGVQAAADNTDTFSHGQGPGRGKQGAMGKRGAAASGASDVIPTNTVLDETANNLNPPTNSNNISR
ncbi:hypothetical protein PAXRUDRAFT_21153 [Paxillus rubicundulus Ve08.2h10]|uniref:Uncharacterized protein n=1 Tax=Paxillus rubicundulus Ve08.2h10 TaxID=930991 RepID=A0A0D0CQS4_9AGAM|nr:hypothetical protein PAXRUDRAFT_21153 [Paxillus rubicundulus Ve08.2h10]